MSDEWHSPGDSPWPGRVHSSRWGCPSNSRLLPLTVTLAFTLAVAAPLAAQSTSESGARVSGFFAGSFGDGGARPGFGVSAGYRFNRYFGFEFDTGYVNGLRLSDERLGPLSLLGEGPDLICMIPEGCPALPVTLRDRGNLLTFTANYVVEIPTGVGWFRPYFLGGGGVGNLSRRIDFFISDPVAMGSRFGLARMQHLDRSETGLVLDAGGGIDFQIVRGLAIGGDVRYFHLFGAARGIDAARVGARVSYRF
jgi:opacity protein-like surface antigen